MFRRKSAARTENLLELLASAQREQELKRKHAIARAAAADEKNAELSTALSELDNLLISALAIDSHIDLDSLKKTPRVPAFNQTKPRRRDYLPDTPSNFTLLLPWKRKAYDRQYAAGESSYRRDWAAYEAALSEHEAQARRIGAETDARNEEIEGYKQDFAAGAPRAIADYFDLVLDRSAYPAAFPKGAEVAFAAESKTLRIDFALPAIDVIPRAKSYAYDENRDELRQTPMPRKQRRRVYASALAQISLRTIYEVFTADRTKKIERIAFAGYVDGIDPGGGQPGRFRLVALSVTRQRFEELDLRQVEPRACLAVLNARLSSKPDQLLPVPPAAEDDMGSQTGSESGDRPDYKRQISELEGEIQTRNAQIAELESEQAAQSERIKELESSLQEEQARNAELVDRVQQQREHIADFESRIEAQNNDSVELDAEPTEAPDDTQPIAALMEFAAESDFKGAEIFAPVASEPDDDDAGGAPIPPREGEAPANETSVTLRSLLVGEAGEEVDEPTAAVGPAKQPAIDGRPAAAAPVSAESMERESLIQIIGRPDSDSARLLTLMMEANWRSSKDRLQSEFPGEFVNVIVEEINERAYDSIGENIIYEEDGQWVGNEDYCQSIEYVISLPEYRHLRQGDS